LALAMTRLRGQYSDKLIDVVQWCMAIDPLSRPQSVFALQKELNREEAPTYTPPSLVDKLKLSLGGIWGGKAVPSSTEASDRSSFQNL